MIEDTSRARLRTPQELCGELTAALGTDPDRYADLFAPDGRLEMPFRRPGIPEAWQGREQIRAAATAGWAAVPLRFDDVRNLRVHETADPEVVVAEHDLVGAGTADGRPFSFPFVWILRVRNGQIAVLREYLNVIDVALATDRVPELAASVETAGSAEATEATAGDRPGTEPPAAAVAPPPTKPNVPAAVFDRYQQAVLDLSPDGIADLFASDCVFEYGFTVPGLPPRLDGREAVRTTLRRLLGGFRFEEYRNVQVHQCLDPELVVVEHDIAGAIVATGRPHVMSYVYVMRARDGQIVHLRDYADLLKAAETAGGLVSFLDRLSRFRP
jgi:ketosteroid isomerase-like protein